MPNQSRVLSPSGSLIPTFRCRMLTLCCLNRHTSCRLCWIWCEGDEVDDRSSTFFFSFFLSFYFMTHFSSALCPFPFLFSFLFVMSYVLSPLRALRAQP